MQALVPATNFKDHCGGKGPLAMHFAVDHAGKSSDMISSLQLRGRSYETVPLSEDVTLRIGVEMT